MSWIGGSRCALRSMAMGGTATAVLKAIAKRPARMPRCPGAANAMTNAISANSAAPSAVMAAHCMTWKVSASGHQPRR